ncbi:hypothetical protein LDENG_00125760 [Lucifuga dentata]|nr:hypothetical protein LDENG_00125760 [Lucifuga dentata]
MWSGLCGGESCFQRRCRRTEYLYCDPGDCYYNSHPAPLHLPVTTSSQTLSAQDLQAVNESVWVTKH